VTDYYFIEVFCVNLKLLAISNIEKQTNCYFCKKLWD